MPEISERWAWLLRHPLLVFLPAQTALLFHDLSLLPVWGDEQFTLNVIGRPWSEIPAVLRSDVHPPLYYLILRCWTQIPWPGTSIDQIRAFSAVCCLLSTAVIFLFWVRRCEPRTQWMFLVAWTLSPALLLYGRMGRSYTLQLLCGCLVILAARRFSGNPKDRRGMLLYSCAAALLLYVHYLPGIALVAAVTLDYLWRRWRRHQTIAWKPLWLSFAVILTLYLPWIWTLLSTIGRVATTDAYRLTSNYLLEHLVRLAYWFFSFTYGEALPSWAFVTALGFTPLLVWSLSRIAPDSQSENVILGPHLVVAAAIAYTGTAMWVAIPFTPARTLFLLPFYLLWLVDAVAARNRAATAARAALVVIWLAGAASYFQAEHFLNKGYLVPFSQMADDIRSNSRPLGSLVLIDGYNVDPKPLVAELCGAYRCLVVRDEKSWRAATREAQDAQAATVWYLRATHDVSPGGLNDQLESAWEANYQSRRRSFLPYSALERFLLHPIGRKNPATHFYQMLELHPRIDPLRKP